MLCQLSSLSHLPSRANLTASSSYSYIEVQILLYLLWEWNTSDDATHEQKDLSYINVIIGKPIHSRSLVVVCPEHIKVSKHRSAKGILPKCSFLESNSLKISLDESIPLHLNSSQIFYSPSAGNFKSYITEFGTHLRIHTHKSRLIGDILYNWL